MTEWPWRIWTRAPAAGTLFPSQVAGADHGPLLADRFSPEPMAALSAAWTQDVLPPRIAGTSATVIVSAAEKAPDRSVVIVLMLLPLEKSSRAVRFPQQGN